MKKLLHHADKVLLGLCVLLFLGSAVWATLSFRRLDEIAALNPSLAIVPAKHEPAPVQVPEIVRDVWPEPPSQSRGSDWVYDVFTPPVLYYDPNSREFSVTRPEFNVPVAEVETPFEVDLVSVKQEPYRIQLVGYVRNEGDFVGQFEILDTSAVLLGRQGHVFGDAQGNFTVRSLEVRRVTTNPQDSMPIVQDVAFATIVDGRTGREVKLTNQERLMMPRLQCVVRTRVYPPEEHTLREGMKITVNGYDYLIVQLSLNPAQAVVSRRPPNSIGGAETRTLIPVGGTASGRVEPAVPVAVSEVALVVRRDRVAALESCGAAARRDNVATLSPTLQGGYTETSLRCSAVLQPACWRCERRSRGQKHHATAELLAFHFQPFPRDISIDSPRVSLFPNLPP